LELAVRHVSHVRFATGKRGDLAGVDVESDDAESGPRELDRQRQSDVAEADDAEAG
jgi:hypothetical protein